VDHVDPSGKLSEALVQYSADRCIALECVTTNVLVSVEERETALL
jgi:hypothetical protein